MVPVKRGVASRRDPIAERTAASAPSPAAAVDSSTLSAKPHIPIKTDAWDVTSPGYDDYDYRVTFLNGLTGHLFS